MEKSRDGSEELVGLREGGFHGGRQSVPDNRPPATPAERRAAERRAAPRPRELQLAAHGAFGSLKFQREASKVLLKFSSGAARLLNEQGSVEGSLRRGWSHRDAF